jgi:predicted nuclease of predicted toxin-antitoxin system
MKSRVIRGITRPASQTHAEPAGPTRRATNVRVKVDEDLPRQIVNMLNMQGHQAVSVLDQGWQGVSDDVLWPRIQAEGRWLITADKGFADLRRHPPGTHAGVILLRPEVESRGAYLQLAETAFQRLDLDHLAAAVIVVTNRGVRIRRAHGSR